MDELGFFDAEGDVAILQRRLPHWSQAGVVCFITFRTHDSIPVAVLQRFHADRRHWLRCNGIDPDSADWKQQLKERGQELRHEFLSRFSSRWHSELDVGHGACVLAQPELSKIVMDSFLHFDGARYVLTDAVVMPNHVHLLVAFPDDESMLKQCESWKHFSATKINRKLGQKGRFWQQDAFDHLVRSEDQFERFRRYIADNPKKANLPTGTYATYSK